MALRQIEVLSPELKQLHNSPVWEFAKTQRLTRYRVYSKDSSKAFISVTRCLQALLVPIKRKPDCATLFTYLKAYNGAPVWSTEEVRKFQMAFEYA